VLDPDSGAVEAILFVPQRRAITAPVAEGKATKGLGDLELKPSQGFAGLDASTIVVGTKKGRDVARETAPSRRRAALKWETLGRQRDDVDLTNRSGSGRKAREREPYDMIRPARLAGVLHDTNLGDCGQCNGRQEPRNRDRGRCRPPARRHSEMSFRSAAAARGRRLTTTSETRTTVEDFDDDGLSRHDIRLHVVDADRGSRSIEIMNAQLMDSRSEPEYDLAIRIGL
jgi:hypothetical protein